MPGYLVVPQVPRPQLAPSSIPQFGESAFIWMAKSTSIEPDGCFRVYQHKPGAHKVRSSMATVLWKITCALFVMLVA